VRRIHSIEERLSGQPSAPGGHFLPHRGQVRRSWPTAPPARRSRSYPA
jgi:hypothetical protein